jgi:predicted metal-binding protein
MKQCIETYFDGSKELPITGIPFDNEVRKLCEQNACGKFGKSWTCPPAIGSIEELRKGLARFDHFLVFYKVYTLEDSFDWEGMASSVKDFHARVFKLRKDVKQKKPEFDFLVLGAGACQLCETCTYTQNKPCRLPDDAMFSVEAYGIDAMKMMQDNGLKYNNGPNTVTYVGGLIY